MLCVDDAVHVTTVHVACSVLHVECFLLSRANVEHSADVEITSLWIKISLLVLALSE